jgi:hypothetical protein
MGLYWLMNKSGSPMDHSRETATDKPEMKPAIPSDLRTPFSYNVVATEITECTLPENVRKSLYHLSSVYSG